MCIKWCLAASHTSLMTVLLNFDDDEGDPPNAPDPIEQNSATSI